MLPLTMAHYNLLIAIAAIVFLAVGTEASGGIGFNLHHRFSPVVRQWMEARGHSWLPESAPKGSPEYYSALVRHDRARLASHRRGLANADGQSTLVFADGNATRRLDSHTYLYYAEVEVGTPSSKFLVALDTGSDLFWLPCKTTGGGSNTTDTEWPSYSPSQSSTSKALPCDHPLCNDGCAAAATPGNGSSSCTFSLRYVDNTGSSGVVVEDVLHFTDTGGGGKAVQAPIVLGCAQVHTTSDGGTMGLGREKVSVPSSLATSGLVASDSFSMCFSRDGAGRINFGDAGSPDQAETPFIAAGSSSSQSTFYSISVTAISVDSKAMPVEFAAVVDSGASFTYLADPAYTLLTTKFDSGVYERRANYGSGVFEYCYSLSPGQTKLKRLPEVSLTTKGGAVFPITWPIVPVPSDEPDPQIIGYCLGVIKRRISIDSSLDYVIGENFMTGLNVVFDRKRSVLGWEKFDFYKDAKMQDGGSPDTSIGSSGDSAPGSSGSTAPVGSPDYVPFVPLPSENNATAGGLPYPGDGPVPLPWPASSGSGSGSGSGISSRGFGGILSSIMLSVLLVASLV